METNFVLVVTVCVVDWSLTQTSGRNRHRVARRQRRPDSTCKRGNYDYS